METCLRTKGSPFGPELPSTKVKSKRGVCRVLVYQFDPKMNKCHQIPKIWLEFWVSSGQRPPPTEHTLGCSGTSMFTSLFQESCFNLQ